MITEKSEMFSRIYLFLNLLFACEITFRCCYGLDLKYRKQIYYNYVSLNKFEGEWIDPHSFGIFDVNVEFEEDLDDSYSHNSEEIRSNKEKETRENLKSFSEQRMLPKNKLLDGVGIGDIFVTDDNSFFALGRNLTTVSSILTLVIFILLRMFPKSLIFSFMLIVSMLWHWVKLYLEKIAEKQNVTENLRHPNECHRANLHWYEAIYLYLSSYVSSPTDCKEYYKAQFVDPFWEVSLPMAFMNAFTSTICEPMKVFATTIRYCFSVMFSGLTLLELSITLFSFFIFLLMYNRYSFSFLWGAVNLYRPRIFGDQTASPSVLSWGSIIKNLKALFIRESALIRPSELIIPPYCKEICFSNEDDKMKVSEKPCDELQKQEKNTNNVQQNLILQSASLHSELTIPPYHKEIHFSNEDDKMKVSEKTHDEFQKQEKSTNNVQQNPILQSASLHSEKNHTVVALKISQFRKCHKKSLSS